MEDSPPKTPKSAHLQKNTNTVVELFSSLGACVNPSRIIDCFHLSIFKVKQIKTYVHLLNLTISLMLLPFWQTKLVCHLNFYQVQHITGRVCSWDSLVKRMLRYSYKENITANSLINNCNSCGDINQVFGKVINL